TRKTTRPATAIRSSLLAISILAALTRIYPKGQIRRVTVVTLRLSPPSSPRTLERFDTRLSQPSRVETISVGARRHHLDETEPREYLHRSWRAVVAASVALNRPQHLPHRGGYRRKLLFRCPQNFPPSLL